jgi:hypothetical protein
MFAEYSNARVHGGNALVLRSILQREPRSLRSFL